jgi:hypothetical protein
MSTPRCILLLHADIGDQNIISSFVDSIRLVLQDYEHVTLHTHIGVQHIPSFVDSILILLEDYEHVAYPSIMPTLEINPMFLPLPIRFA